MVFLRLYLGKVESGGDCRVGWGSVALSSMRFGRRVPIGSSDGLAGWFTRGSSGGGF
jgi:hypothetical protein